MGNPYDVKSSPLLRHLVFGGSGADVLTGGDNGDHLYGGGGNDVLTAGAGDDHLEGQLGNDDLKGEDGRDILLGGAGSDTLAGGLGNDRLEGGLGNDVYVLSSANKANDIIRDLDGRGSIQLDGSPLSGGDYVSSGVWRRNNVTYTFVPDASGRGTLFIIGAAGNLTVERFAPGELGIVLPGPVVVPTPVVDRTLTGDLAPIDFDPAASGVQMQYDALGNVLTDPGQAEPDRADTFYDSTANDKILAAGGNDILHADRGGNDSIDSGSGDDLATAGAGNDTVEGGAGSDTLVGNLDNDALLGSEGNDILVSGAGDDFLMGDETADTWSDFKYMSVDPGWMITREVTTRPDGVTLYKRTYTQANAWVDSGGGADPLYGGAGDDWMFGNLGNDVLLGGIGQDVLFGEESNDLLYGQDGDDVISGDSLQDTDGSGIPGGLHGADMLEGGKGNDTLAGNGGDDKLYGGDGNDEISGDDGITPGDFHGNDSLEGGLGNDVLSGDELHRADGSGLGGSLHGADYLDGEDGNDALDGGDRARIARWHMARTGYMGNRVMTIGWIAATGRKGFSGVDGMREWKEAA